MITYNSKLIITNGGFMKRNIFIIICLIFNILNIKILYSTVIDSTHIGHVTIWDNPTPGFIFVSPNNQHTLSVTDNSGGNVILKNNSSNDITDSYIDFKKHFNGLYSYYDFKMLKYYITNPNYDIIDSVTCVGNYMVDFHDFLILRNGNMLLLGTETRIMDLSIIVPGGNPEAHVGGYVIQEIDRNKNLVFEWHSFDHIPITDATPDVDLTQITIDYIHCNAFEEDLDGNILLSNRYLDEVTKINRITGEIIWRLGGKYCKNNQFTFINDSISNGFFGFTHQHSPRRLPNGNLIMLDNGNLRYFGTDTRPYSRIVEYHLDEINKIATKVWEFKPEPELYIPVMGNVQQLSNGNIFICWGIFSDDFNDTLNPVKPIIYEVNRNGDILLRMELNVAPYRAYKYDVNLNSKTMLINSIGTLNFNDVSDTTAITLVIDTLALVENGEINVTRYDYPPLDQSYDPKLEICNAYPIRWVITRNNIESFKGKFIIDLTKLAQFNIKNPGEALVFWRNIEGQGVFEQLNPTYNSVTQTIEVELKGYGEIMIASRLPESPVLTKPEDNATKIPIKGTLYWECNDTEDSFEVNIATDDDFNNIVIRKSGVKGTSYDYSGLNYSKDYYWRVRLETKLCQSDWSEFRHFITELSPPNPVMPANNSTGIDLKESLVWEPVSKATAYNIQVASDSNFANIILNQPSVVNTSVKLQKLNYNQIYFWRIQAESSNDESPWSVTRKFMTVLPETILESPENYANGVPVDARLSWQKNNSSNYYQVEVSDSANFIDKIISTDNIADTYVIARGLDNLKKYYWHVRAFDSINKSNWSESREFNTIIGSPLLESPENNSLHASIKGILIWLELPGATSYHSQLALDSEFIQIIDDVTDLHSNLTSYNNLNFSTNYYWRVKACYQYGCGEWSQAWLFQTRDVNELDLPILTYPSDYEKAIKVDSSLVWDAVDNAEAYHVQISLDSCFNDIFDEENNIITNIYKYKELSNNTQYYWRVAAQNSTKKSGWSEIYCFTTKLPTPILLYPYNNKDMTSTTSKLIWNNVEGATEYYVLLSESPDFLSLVLENRVQIPEIPFTDLNTSTDYYWKVMALEPFNQSEWSQPFTFKTNKVKDVESNIINKNTQIIIYPNPASVIVNCQLSIDNSQLLPYYLTIKLYDLLGSERSVIFEGYISSENQLISKNISNLPNGAYLYKIQDSKHQFNGILLIRK